MKTEELQENWNTLVKLLDQFEYLENEEEASDRALSRARSKIESVSEIIDMRQAEGKLEEVEKLLDAQERIVQMKERRD